MIQKVKKRKCPNCGERFVPNPRAAKKHIYCKKPDCRKASKAAAQARWLAKKENKNYFCGPDNVCRVQDWRKRNPGYWRRKGPNTEDALQDQLIEKSPKEQGVATESARDALQDLLIDQHTVFIGLISHLTGNTLQDEIANTTLRLRQLGSDILNLPTPNVQRGDYGKKNPCSSRSGPSST